MKTLRARVVNGRFVIDEPSGLPEGSVVELVLADQPKDEADISGPEHASLRDALKQSEAEFSEGLGHTIGDLIASRKVVGARNR